MRRVLTKEDLLPEGVLIDDEDLELISKYNRFHIRKRGEVSTVYQKTINGKKTRKTIKLHRLIMGVTDPKLVVDHINRNQLDNRKVNLRVCTQLDNGKNLSLKKNNTSGFSGVHWDKSRNKWVARVKVAYRGIHLGRYDTLEEAISARLFGEDYYFGEFAPNLGGTL